MHAQRQHPSMRGRRREARRRTIGRVLALALLLHASPALPAWLALHSNDAGTRLVQLCTGKGLRLVEVPAEDVLAAADAGEDAGSDSASGCVLCTLGKCSGCGSIPGPTACARFEPPAAGAHARAAVTQQRPKSASARLRPPSRGPPVLV